MAIASRQKKQIQAKQLAKIKLLWPNFDDLNIWDRSYDGYMTLPKTLPLILAYMDKLKHGSRMSASYLALWSNTWDTAYLEITDEKRIAMESGFTGERAVHSWKERMKSLVEWGFIEVKAASHEYSYVVILNPHLIIKDIHDHKRSKLDEKVRAQLDQIYTVILLKDSDVGGDGFKPTLVFNCKNCEHNF